MFWKKFRSTFFLVACAGSFFLAPTIHAQTFVTTSGTQLMIGKKIFLPRGVNVLDERSLWSVTTTIPGTNIQESDYAWIRAHGMNSIRLAVKADYFDGPAGFRWLDQQIAWARQYGLKILLDMHIPTGGAQEDYQPSAQNDTFWHAPEMLMRFVDTWRRLAGRYANESVIWGYDVINEPSLQHVGIVTHYVQTVREAIRSSDKNHPIIIEPVKLTSPDGVESYVFPDVWDEHRVWSIHMYHPYRYTLQGLNQPTVTSTVLYPSLVPQWDQAWVDQDIQRMGLTEARQKQIPVIMGEFGTTFHEKPRGQERWIGQVLSTAKRAQMGWYYWAYRTTQWNGSTALRDARGRTRMTIVNTLQKALKTP